ncbi:hypothetical protein BKA62DRAFT_793140 [Auriculariales sp. MPI-PUGE-AT-0066]|nr:hypothetical protein BKA62DRAFT_793140 [Auriculariales sp. MPI-PUGE-AT-0066]
MSSRFARPSLVRKHRRRLEPHRQKVRSKIQSGDQSARCILAELHGRKPIFTGRDYVDQLNQILQCLGTPTEDALRRIGSPRVQEYIRTLPIRARVPFSQMYRNANAEALDLPRQNALALAHPYLAQWYDEFYEPKCESIFEFGFEDENSMDCMKNRLLEWCLRLHT